MPQTTNPIQLVLFINGGTKGYSEKYFLDGTALGSVVGVGNTLCQHRAALLGDGLEIAWARVSHVDSERLSKAVITAPMPAIHDGDPDATANGYGTVNKIEDALLFRLETVEGKQLSRSIRGIPDNRISDDELVGAFADIATAAAPITVPGGSPNDWITALKNFLAYIKVNTFHMKKIAADPVNYELTPWEKTIFRRAAIRQTGRPFDTSVGRR